MGHAGAIVSRIYKETSSPEIGNWREQGCFVQLCKQVCKTHLNGWDEISQIKMLRMGVSPLTSEGFQYPAVQDLTG